MRAAITGLIGIILAVPSAGSAAPIVVLAGTYGANCGQPRGNKTDHLASACNGQSQCTYTVDYQVTGDPAVGCGKNYVAEWRCGHAAQVHRAEVAPEAGFRKTLTLSCAGHGGHHGGGPWVAGGGGITVVAGTYGGNCGQPRGNKTPHLASACNGQSQCNYTVDYQVIGDPAVGCGKSYVAEWRCGDGGQVFRAEVAPEAGFRKTMTLSCAGHGGHGGHGGHHGGGAWVAGGRGITVVAGTYGGNCGQPRGNKTPHLASACNGQSQCNYTVDYRVIGDPAVGCGKSYVAEWRCGDGGQVFRAEVAPEAGFRKALTLSCAGHGGHGGHGGHHGGGAWVAGGRGITVVAGTYGGNCGQPRGNKTPHLASACNGQRQCSYVIDYQVIGDPAVGCGKTYVAEWRCGGSNEPRRAEVAPEAGYRKTVTLTCP